MASVWAAIEKDRKFLLVQRSFASSRPAQWCFPGGGIHVGESPEIACVREVAEEVGLKATILGSLAVFPGQQYFHCVIEQGPIQLKANECQAYEWVEPSALLSVGEIMELRKVIHVLQLLGYDPQLPGGVAS